MNIYGLFYLLAGTVVFAYFLVQVRRHHLSASVAVDAAIVSVPLALCGAHVAFAVLEPGGAGNLARFFLSWNGWESGYLSFGGVAGILCGLAVAARLHRLRFALLADLAGPVVFIGSVFGRLGCFFHGCCYGAPSGVPWAVRFPSANHPGDLTPPSHPVQLYEVLLSLGAFFAVITLLPRFSIRPGSGKVLALCLIVYLAIRFVEEFFRIGGSSRLTSVGLSTTQIVTIAAVALCAGLMCIPSHRVHGPSTPERS